MHCLRVSGSFVAILLAAALAGCGDDTPLPLAQTSNATAEAPVAGPTPFIARVDIDSEHLDHLASASFVVTPMAGTVSKPVAATYSAHYLLEHALLTDKVRVPLFGLYAGTANTLDVTLTFDDDTSVTLPVDMTTAAYTSPIYSTPEVVVARVPGATLGYDFIYMKSLTGTPVIIDTDGHPRWVAPHQWETTSSTFTDNGFVLGSLSSPQVARLELDGTFRITGTLDTPDVYEFHHDMEAGKTGLLNNVDRLVDGVHQLESTAQEFTPDGHVLAQWDLGQIISDYMLANGDDPTLFVRPGIDWFHMNTAIYDPADDSLLVSSRENFVIKLDYTTKEIRWIFGDPTKYWYSFPSLRARALALVGDGLWPIGQHSLTIAPDGNLLLFNNGNPSVHQPEGAPAGEGRPYAAVSSYKLDETAMTAVETWHFDYNQSIFSPICSSTQQLADGSIMIDYASTDSFTGTRIVGLDAAHRVAFDYHYPSDVCDTAWNSQPIALDAMSFD